MNIKEGLKVGDWFKRIGNAIFINTNVTVKCSRCGKVLIQLRHLISRKNIQLSTWCVDCCGPVTKAENISPESFSNINQVNGLPIKLSSIPAGGFSSPIFDHYDLIHNSLNGKKPKGYSWIECCYPPTIYEGYFVDDDGVEQQIGGVTHGVVFGPDPAFSAGAERFYTLEEAKSHLIKQFEEWRKGEIK